MKVRKLILEVYITANRPCGWLVMAAMQNNPSWPLPPPSPKAQVYLKLSKFLCHLHFISFTFGHCFWFKIYIFHKSMPGIKLLHCGPAWLDTAKSFLRYLWNWLASHFLRNSSMQSMLLSWRHHVSYRTITPTQFQQDDLWKLYLSAGFMGFSALSA